MTRVRAKAPPEFQAMSISQSDIDALVLLDRRKQAVIISYF
jgi:hypothetical protein